MVIAPLDRKLLRDLWRMRGQVVTIALVVACGVASYVAMSSVDETMRGAQTTYYRVGRFADVFARLRRAPESVAQDLRAVDGVDVVETRLAQDVILDVADMREPATAHVVSVPSGRQPELGRLHLRRGRWIDPTHPDEVLLSEPFAREHRLEPGSTLGAVLHGRRQVLRVVGVVLSAEYVYSMPPGALMPDDRRFGIVWMDRAAMASAWRMEAEFNDVTFRLSRGASEPAALAAIDRVLAPWGSPGAYTRNRQPSHRLVDAKLGQIHSMSTTVPVLFLLVAAFLVNVVLDRTIASQREQLAALKALGFTNREVASHYGRFVLFVVALGAVEGIALGAKLGSLLTGLYAQYFRFPALDYHLSTRSIVPAILLSLGTVMVGALSVLRRSAALPPAEAMRPEAPPSYLPTLLERAGFHTLFSQAARMVLRDMERRPMRTLMAVLGIAFATSIMIAGSFSHDAIDYLMDVQFREAQREDLTLVTDVPTPEHALAELRCVPGVLRVEGMFSVPVRVRHGHLWRETVVQGIDPRGALRRVFDANDRQVALPPSGIVLSRVLAQRLALRRGDVADVEVLFGARDVRRVVVSDVVDDFVGLGSYMALPAARALARDDGSVTEILVSVDPRQIDRVYDTLKGYARVAGVTRRDQMIRFFRSQSADVMLSMTIFLSIVASVITLAVVYNSARIALALRSRDLASLRVLGFTRAEVAAVIVGEQLAQVVMAIPIGLALGRMFAGASWPRWTRRCSASRW